MELSKVVASKLSDELMKRKMSQYKLEKITGLPHSTVKSIMSAKNRGINLRTLLIICRALKISASDFFDEEFDNEEIELE